MSRICKSFRSVKLSKPVAARQAVHFLVATRRSNLRFGQTDTGYRKQDLHVIGLSGGIATGKSIVTRNWRENGACVIDCDEIARHVLRKGSWTYRRVLRHFGRDILLPSGQIDRAKLSDIVFSNDEKRRKLNSITHSVVLVKIIWQLCMRWLAHDFVVIVDMPLLYETGMYRWTWPNVVVTCPEAMQIERMIVRDGCTAHQARLKSSAQMPMKHKESRATYVIDNGGSKASTYVQAATVLSTVRARAKWHGIFCSPLMAALCLVGCYLLFGRGSSG
ncbi:hypothetical protein WJX73_004333 [Symbiochloris irregularis]|uniref:Dephospho-CoA kinase n=1 Tax=Symbiochloris irregularis TaxID=706552 RepID=A0AAW1PIQ0_9CHLO